jgi:ribokinase
VDTTGAGDALAGALAAGLAAGKDLADALAVGCRFAAVSVTRTGAWPSYPSGTDL